jgi:endo-1,4-beta-xylanase
MKNMVTVIQLLSAMLVASSVYGADMKEQSLKNAFEGRFHVGASLNSRVFPKANDSSLSLVARQFDSISPGNLLKWQPFNPKPGVYNLDKADAFVQFGRKNDMYVVGHVLFWHNQTPQWVFQGKDGKQLSRDELLKRMRERVRYVAKRYGNKIQAWDVVNESIMDNGSLRKSKWTQVIGDDFIEQAFRIAADELPADVELIYNDYSMTGKKKRDAVVKLVTTLKKKNIRIDGVGMQGHWGMGGPSVAAIEASIIAFSKTGVDVHITELDIDVLPRKSGMWDADIRKKLAQDPSMDPYKKGLPAEIQKKLAARYKDIFGVFLKHQDKIKRVTFWGVTDGDSWLNGWPIKGRTSYPLLFDREGKPKPAFHAVIDLTEKK